MVTGEGGEFALPARSISAAGLTMQRFVAIDRTPPIRPPVYVAPD